MFGFLFGSDEVESVAEAVVEDAHRYPFVTAVLLAHLTTGSLRLSKTFTLNIPHNCPVSLATPNHSHT